MTTKLNFLLLGNRSLAVNIFEFLVTLPEVQVKVILNPEDDGKNFDGGISLKNHLDKKEISYLQPNNLLEILPEIKQFSPAVALSCSYSKIIPQIVIDSINEFWNIHYADLPKNRGCLPVVWTIANGERNLTVTMHEVILKLDAGAIIAKSSMKIPDGCTSQEGYRICSELAYELFVEFWKNYQKNNQYVSYEQDESLMTYHSFVFPNDRWIDCTQSCKNIAAFINALTYYPHPSARLKLLDDKKELCILGPAKYYFDDTIQINCIGHVVIKNYKYCLVCIDGFVSFEKVRIGDLCLLAKDIFGEMQVFKD